MSVNKLLGKELKVINLGLKSFEGSLKKQNVDVLHFNWQPPAGGNIEILKILEKLNTPKIRQKIKRANDKAVERLILSQPVLVDIQRAKDALGIDDNTILHAGPPIKWDRMCGPVKGAILGALVYEGKAKSIKQAEQLVKKNKIKFAPCHHHNAVGPMAGIISPSMYVFVIKNMKYKNYAYCTLNEGLGKVLRFGAYSAEVIKKLKWMEQVLAPGLRKAVKLSGGINIKNIIIQALQMGDECHNRNVSATNLFIKEIIPYLLKTDLDKKTIADIINFISSNAHFFLNLSMPSAKSMVDTIKGLKNSSIMCAMARNGTDIGIRVAGTGDKWFVAEAGAPKGLYFSGFSEKDACADLGDSTITETAGIGGFAMACAPAIVKFVGGVPDDAINFTKEMYEIAHSRHRDFQIPVLNFIGTPVGVDIIKVVEKQITPFINTGIAHKKPGIGQVGAGLLRANMKCFEDALISFNKTI